MGRKISLCLLSLICLGNTYRSSGDGITAAAVWSDGPISKYDQSLFSDKYEEQQSATLLQLIICTHNLAEVDIQDHIFH